MKKFNLLFLSLLTMVVLFSSCEENTVDDSSSSPLESATLNSALNQLESLYYEDGSQIVELHPTGNLVFDFCFEFVYPINLSFNTGSTVTIYSDKNLITTIINQTSELFIVGIDFPFQVTVFNPDIGGFDVVVIADENDFANLLNSCDFNTCDCGFDYDPVCVGLLTSDGIEIVIEFPNACVAECEGFTSSDFIECSLQGDCSITDIFLEVGDCNTEGTYKLVLDFNYSNVPSGYDNFTVEGYIGGVFSGSYALSDLPITIVDFDSGNSEVEGLLISIDGLSNCLNESETFKSPCYNNGEDCEITNLVVEVGECNYDGTYELMLDFDYLNVPSGYENFTVEGVIGGSFLGTYALSDLPLTIAEFNSGTSLVEGILVSIDGLSGCIGKSQIFQNPCYIGGGCKITNIVTTVGDCNTNGTYELIVDFDYLNIPAGAENFTVHSYVTGSYLGKYTLTDLPITIVEVDSGASNVDGIVIAIAGNGGCLNESGAYNVPICD